MSKMNVLIFKFMIVCVDCFKLFQTISNTNKTCNGPGSQSESENRTWHHAHTSRKKNVFYILFERIINVTPYFCPSVYCFTRSDSKFVSCKVASSVPMEVIWTAYSHHTTWTIFRMKTRMAHWNSQWYKNIFITL